MTTALLLLACLCTSAQQFFNLTAEEVRVDTLLPRFTYSQELGSDYADSVYTVSIDYPEFIDMSPADVKRYHAITGDTLPELPGHGYGHAAGCQLHGRTIARGRQDATPTTPCWPRGVG